MLKRNLYFNPITGEFRFDQEYGQFTDIPQTISWQPDDGINKKAYGFKNLTLNLTMNCNLQCKYCWQQHGCCPDMTKQVIDRWLDFFLDEKCNSPAKVLYFGGEPLLRLDLIQYSSEHVAEICKKRGIKKPQQQIFTNATLLSDEAIALVKKEGIYLILSIDGNDEINSLNRVDPYGKSVQQQIHDGIQRLKQQGVPFGVCSTMSDIEFNVDKTIRYIIEEIHPTSIEFNVRYDRDFMNKYRNSSELSFSSFFQAWDLIRESDVENVNFKKRIRPLALRKPLQNSSSGSKNKIAIMPDGKVSPFNSAIQYPNLQIDPVGDWLAGFRTQWKRNILLGNQCRNCTAAFICGQGSAFSSFLEYGDFMHVPFLHCEYCAAMMTYVMRTLRNTLGNTVPEGYVVSTEDIVQIFKLSIAK